MCHQKELGGGNWYPQKQTKLLGECDRKGQRVKEFEIIICKGQFLVIANLEKKVKPADSFIFPLLDGSSY